jgi:platelet-activating factor acetylhydrolase
MYSTICGDMASYGIIVCAVEHRDHSGSYSWTQNEPQDVTYVKQPENLTEKEFRSGQINVRVEEIDLAWKFFQELNEGKFEHEIIFNENSADYIKNPSLEPFKNRLDLENPILIGHSFGGATVLEYSSRDDHPFKCTVVMDAWMTPIDPKPISTPVLSINTEGFTNWKENFETVDKHIRSILETNSNSHLASIHKIEHYHQSDGPNLLLTALKLYYRKLKIEPKRATELNNGLAISFIADVFKNNDLFKDKRLNIPSWDLLKSEKLWNEDFYFHNLNE